MRGRIYRSKTDSVVAGVCGGLGQYLGIDPVLVRLLFVALALSGSGLVLYFMMWIIIPQEDQEDATRAEAIESGALEIKEQVSSFGERLRSSDSSGSMTGMLVGAGLVLFGLAILVQNLHLPWLQWFGVELVWPLLLVLAGIALIQRRTSDGSREDR